MFTGIPAAYSPGKEQNIPWRRTNNPTCSQIAVSWRLAGDARWQIANL
jgi:hypothetical protein